MPAPLDRPQPLAATPANLLDLAELRLDTLLAEPDPATTSTLDSVVKRLLDPRDREQLTVSAFASSL